MVFNRSARVFSECLLVGYLERGEYSPSLALAFRIARFFELVLHVRFDIAPLLGAMLPVASPLCLFAPSAFIAWHRSDV